MKEEIFENNYNNENYGKQQFFFVFEAVNTD